MKDFDAFRAERRAKADREFKVGGEVFVMRASVRPEVLAGFEEIESASNVSALPMIDAFIADLIEPDDDAIVRWKAVRENEEDALSLGDLMAVLEWLLEEQTQRTPTQPASGSTAGPGKTGTTLTVA